MAMTKTATGSPVLSSEHSAEADVELRWYTQVYQGDRIPQFTLRAFILEAVQQGSAGLLLQIHVGGRRQLRLKYFQYSCAELPGPPRVSLQKASHPLLDSLSSNWEGPSAGP
jgi:hypothetical protein